MDPSRPREPLALGAASTGAGAARSVPQVDERLAPPETRIEYLAGREVFTMGADRPHATQHSRLDYLLAAHAAAGYESAVDLLTRTGHATDVAPDASIFPSAPDPATGGRRIEELAFEVTSQQRLSVPTERARALVERGVRRVFCVLVNEGRVVEWSRATDGWSPLGLGAEIDDPCIARPLPVRALLSAAEADDAVVRGLDRKGNPAIREIEARGRADGLAPVARMCERRLGRSLTPSERGALLAHLGALGPERIGDAVLDLAPKELEAWLADPEAR